MNVVATAVNAVWPQPIAPVHSASVSAMVAAIPLAIVLVLMGLFRRSGLFASAWGLAAAVVLALGIWRMPANLAMLTLAYGFAYALWSILWLVFAALLLYNLTVASGSFDLLREWMRRHASDDPCVQAILVAFCFGGLLEGTAGFGAPVAITAFLLVGLGFEARKAVVVSLLANTAPVAFGALGVPIVALAGVTELDTMKLSAMVGRQLPLLSFILPMYISLLVGGRSGLRRCWPAALVTGVSFASVQFMVSNFWGPYATDILSSLASIVVLVAFLKLSSRPAPPAETERTAEVSALAGRHLSPAVAAWLPWAVLSVVMVLWSYLKIFQRGQIAIAIPALHRGVFISLYQKPYAAVFTFQPLATGTGVLVTVLIVALCLGLRSAALAHSARKTMVQLRLPGLTVLFIVGVAYLYNYSGMAYTLGAAAAGAGHVFPVLSSYLGWVACFLTGSDTAANLIFGNLQVAAAHQLHLNPVLLAATNSSGAVTGKMISPQNIAVGVTTVGLVGQEGRVLHKTFLHSVALAAILGLIAYLQAYYLTWMVPQ